MNDILLRSDVENLERNFSKRITDLEDRISDHDSNLIELEAKIKALEEQEVNFTPNLGLVWKDYANFSLSSCSFGPILIKFNHENKTCYLRHWVNGSWNDVWQCNFDEENSESVRKSMKEDAAILYLSPETGIPLS